MRHCPPRLVCLFTVLALAGTTSVMANNETTTPPPSAPGLLSSFAGSKILLIGILNSDLTIITKDASPLVYDVPMAKFDNNKFDLYGLAPVELKSKWPALSGNANFTSKVLSKQLPLSISIKLDSEKLVFVFHFDPDPSRNVLETVTLSANSPSASYQEYPIDLHFFFSLAHFISSTEQNVFFDLVIDPGNPHHLVKYVYQAGGFNLTSTSAMCKQTDTNGTELIVFMKDSTGCTPIDWDIQNGGFVDQNHFHLFSQDTVYIFEYTGTGANPAGVPVTAVKLGDFFVSITPTTITTHSHRSSTRKGGMSTSKIVSIVGLVVLALLLIVLAVMWFKCIKPLHKDLEMSRSSKDPAVQFQTQAQAQSQAQSSQSPKFQNPSGQASNNTSGYKKPMGALSLLAMQNVQSSVVMSSTNNQPKMERQEPKPEPTPEQLPNYDCGTAPAKRFSSKTEKEIKLEKMQKLKDEHKSSSDEEVPADSAEKGALPESEARLAEAEAQKKLNNKTNRPESRQKVSPKQGGSSNSKQKQYRGKQTRKAKLAKLAAKHSKGGKASKGSVASRKPTTKKSLRKMATKGGKATSKASKGSNRKF